MSEKRFYIFEGTIRGNFGEVDKPLNKTEIVNLLNEQQDKMSEKINELEKEDKRLNQVINDLHDDIRSYNRKVKKQHMIINIQWDIIASLMELKGVIEE